ncbi:MAG: type II secretion system protein [Candidatus Paceibacterota bacterium]|jgi:type IV pilus assembly protein PilA|nr:type II secretion system GspH family protein [bacterium]
MKHKIGFTLLEVLLAVAAVTILSGIVILAINPNKQLADARNAQRRIDVNTILNAVYQYAIDKKGTIPTSITTTATPICRSGFVDNCADLAVLTLGQEYLTDIPIDPSSPLGSSSGYTVMKNINNRIIVGAPLAEGVLINATR